MSEYKSNSPASLQTCTGLIWNVVTELLLYKTVHRVRFHFKKPLVPLYCSTLLPTPSPGNPVMFASWTRLFLVNSFYEWRQDTRKGGDSVLQNGGEASRCCWFQSKKKKNKGKCWFCNSGYMVISSGGDIKQDFKNDENSSLCLTLSLIYELVKLYEKNVILSAIPNS